MFQIENRFTGAVQFECELSAEIAGASYGVQLGFAVKKAFETGANLAGANLADANLADAYLAGADGQKLVLVGKRPVLQIGPLGSRCAMLSVYLTDHGIWLRAGCFWGDLSKFNAAVLETHGESGLHADEYHAAIAMIETYAALKEQDVTTPLRRLRSGGATASE